MRYSQIKLVKKQKGISSPKKKNELRDDTTIHGLQKSEVVFQKKRNGMEVTPTIAG